MRVRLSRQYEETQETHLFSTAEEETIWVYAVGYGTAKEWYPVKDERRCFWVSKKQLMQDIEYGRKDSEGGKARSENHSNGGCADLVAQRLRQDLNHAHDQKGLSEYCCCILVNNGSAK